MLKIKRLFIINTFIYLILILGYLYLYVVDLEKFIYNIKEEDVKSKIDFVYQQF